ncbi:uncharacterized protein LOC122093711 [Macadamia integrifolia]|uniref:uncharacterized protein LOC122093711 n=1 Tax=Macadamia integrifolia TaxID=60698 RepID=UPI001C5317C7|nr:uncharacterized protein LOC122093711 [Macadamia integrifolia]
MNKLQEMTMVSNSHRIKNTADSVVATLLISGFAGQLKGWWDYILTENQKTEILTAIQTTSDGTPLLDLEGDPVEDVINTLIFNIVNYFLGNHSLLKHRTAKQLSNLRCKKLHDFKWYKDTFLTKVLTRPDANLLCWKEKFLTGLPTLFSKKIKTLRKENDGIIPFDQMTYGQIINLIYEEGLTLCTDIRLRKLINKENKFYKREFGGFYEQFGFAPLKPPSKHKHKSSKKFFQSNQHKSHKPFTTPVFYQKSTKIPNYRKPKKPFKTSKNFLPSSHSQNCFHCGKPGHIAKYCRISKRINSLQISDRDKTQILALFRETTSSSSSDEQNYNNKNLKLNQVQASEHSVSCSIDNNNFQACACNSCIIGLSCKDCAPKSVRMLRASPQTNIF